jgi:CheY-specific phosphatase CheX
MQSINYKDFEEHKKLHEGFIKTLHDHAMKIASSDFSIKDAMSFTGMLVTWLLYHIADRDQKYVKEVAPKQALSIHGHIVYASVSDVLNKMARFDPEDMKLVETHTETFKESLSVEVGFLGDISGNITFSYPITFVKNMLYAMMDFVPEGIDDLVISALREVSNIISGSVCRHISMNKNIFCDISTPSLVQRTQTPTDERISLDTGQGIVEIDLAVVYK